MRGSADVDDTLLAMNEELIRQVKGSVADPTKAPLLRDLLQAEAARVIAALRDEQFTAGLPYSKEELARRAAAYEALTEDLGRAAALGTYWEKTTDNRIVPAIVARLANAMERSNGVSVWLDLFLYPAVLVLYAGGLGAVLGHREEQLADLLASVIIRDREEWKPVVLVLSAPAAIDHRVAKDLPGLERRRTPMSDHLCEVLRPWLEELEPDQVAYERAFDRFEYLHGLVMFDITRQAGRGGYAPVGRLSWRGEYGNGIELALADEIAAAAASWPPLRGGLFGGDADRLAESVKGWSELIARVRSQRF